MRYLLYVFVLILLSSCQWFESKGVMAQKMIQQDMESIDWNQVDQYPLNDFCDENASKLSQERCFKEQLMIHMQRIFEHLSEDYQGELASLDSIKVMVDTLGIIQLEEVFQGDQLHENEQQFRTLLADSLRAIPHFYPALKRGIPVTVHCKIPIQISIEE